ncbi:uncharacterized protein [Apostichopus japonicus]|uniref:uncharacterized protein isoform X2 n=1 Tax=Stichopus japonicus TaxID=307972 RepID=UPI003AB53D7A
MEHRSRTLTPASLHQEETCQSWIEPGNSYTYSYNATAQTAFDGNFPENAYKTNLICEVLIKSPENCVIVMTTRSCEIFPESEQANSVGDRLNRYDLAAKTNDGLIEEIYPDVREEMEILNIKRGILSALQIQVTEKRQTKIVRNDLSIHGNCSSDMSISKLKGDDLTTVFSVTRDLTSCKINTAQDENVWLMLSPSMMNRAPLRSSQNCNYVTSSGRIEHVSCLEVHTYEPMGIPVAGTMQTTIHQHLELIDYERENYMDYSFRRDERRTTNIVQEIEKEVTEEVSSVDALVDFRQLLYNSRNEVQMDTPRQFNKWLTSLRGLSNDSIHAVFDFIYEYDHSSSGEPEELGREYLWDGLLQCGTLPCLSVINTAIIQNRIPKPLAHIMMYTMAFRDQPTLDLIAEGFRLAQVNRTRSTFLPVSAMIYQYWVEHPELENSELPVPIRNFIQLLEGIIGEDCTLRYDADTPEGIEENRQLLLALKALGNIGAVADQYDVNNNKKKDQFQRDLLRCSRNKNASPNITLGAIQALRRFQPNSFVQRKLMVTFLDNSRQNSVRVASFLFYMNSDFDAMEFLDIYETVQDENDSQFKAFFFSYIRSILDTRNPKLDSLKDKLVRVIGGEDLPEYPKNWGKYSRRYEMARMFNISGNNTLGGSVESDVIFEADQMVPSSMMMRYALHAMGKDWDLIETGLQLEGFDEMADALFGSEGFFPSEISNAIFKTLDESIIPRMRSSVLPLDSLADKLEVLKPTTINKDEKAKRKLQKMKQRNQPIPVGSLIQIFENGQLVSVVDDETADEPEYEILPEVESKLNRFTEAFNKGWEERFATMYIKVLGHELGFVTLDDLRQLATAVDKTMIRDMFLKVAVKLREGMDVNLTRSVVLAEREVIVPTGVGLPLQCSLNGTAVVSMRTTSQVTLQLPSLTASGRIAPSGGIQLLRDMNIRLPMRQGKVGVAAATSVHHSTEIEGSVSLFNGKFTGRLTVPDKPLVLLNVSSDKFYTSNDGQLVPVDKDETVVKSCTQTRHVLGMELCILRGNWYLPSQFSVFLNKTDETLTSYNFEAQFEGKSVKESQESIPKPNKNRGRRFRRPRRESGDQINEYVLRLNFSAPGDLLNRNVTSLMTLTPEKKEVKWSLNIPEMGDLRIFAGLLNLSNPSTGEQGIHAVWNATHNETKLSVSATYMNSTISSKTNYTGVFNASVNDLKYSWVAQHIGTDSFMMTSLNNTYYWDDETSIIDQLNGTDYKINPDKYVRADSYLRCMKNDNEINSVLFLTVFGQNLTLQSLAIKTPESYNNKLQGLFQNSFMNVSLFNASISRDVSKEDENTLTATELNMSRGSYSTLLKIIKDENLTEATQNFTWGIQFRNESQSTGVVNKDGSTDDVEDGKQFNITTFVSFFARNETVGASVPSYYVSMNISVPVIRSLNLTDQTRLQWGFTSRLTNLLSLPENDCGYLFQINSSIPSLNLDVSNELSVVNKTTGTMITTYSHVIRERTSGEQLNISTYGLLDPETKELRSAYYFISPYHNYSGELMTSLNDGFVLRDNISQESSYLPNMANFSQNYFINLKPWRNANMGYYLTNSMLNVSSTHSVQLDGPITEVSLLHLLNTTRDVINMTFHGDLDSLKEILLNVSYTLTNSSINVDNHHEVKSPVILNIDLTHHLSLDSDHVNHSLMMELQGSNSSLNLDHSVEGDFTSITLISEVNGHIHRDNSIRSFTDGRMRWGKYLKSQISHGTIIQVPSLVNSSVTADFTIDKLRSYSRFDVMQSNLYSQMESIFGVGSLHGRLNLYNFRTFSKFAQSSVYGQSMIESRFFNWTSAGGIDGNGFASLSEFGNVQTHGILKVHSPFAKFDCNCSTEVDGREGKYWVKNIQSSNLVNFESFLGNGMYNFSYHMDNIESLFTFDGIDGSSDFHISSLLLNISAVNRLDFDGFDNTFDFERIHGFSDVTMVSFIGDSNVTHYFQIESSSNLRTFEKVKAGLQYSVDSEMYGTGQLLGTFVVYNNYDVLSFSLGEVSLKGDLTSYLVNSTFGHFSEVHDMAGPFAYSFANSEGNYDLSLSFFNATGNYTSSTTGRKSMFVVENVTNEWHYVSSTSISNMNIKAGTSLVHATGFASHELLLNTFQFHWDTPLGNIKTEVQHNQQNMQNIFTFHSSSITFDFRIDGKFVNTTSYYYVMGEGFLDLFTFDSFNISAYHDGMTRFGRSSAGYDLVITEVSTLSFKEFCHMESMNFTSSIFNLSTMLENRVHNFKGFMKYDFASSESIINLQSHLLHHQFYSILRATESKGVTQLDRVEVRSRMNTTSSIHRHIFNTNLTVSGMRGVFKVDNINWNVVEQIQFSNLSIDVSSVYGHNGQTSLFTYDGLSIKSNVSISSPKLLFKTDYSYNVLGSSGLFQRENVKFWGMTSFRAYKVSGRIVFESDVKDQTGISSFAEYHTKHNITFESPFINLTSVERMEMQDQLHMLYFKRLQNNGTFNLTILGENMHHGWSTLVEDSSGWWTLQNMVFTYDFMSQGSVNCSNSFLFTIGGCSGFGHFEEMVLSHTTQISSEMLNGTSSANYTLAGVNGDVKRISGGSNAAFDTPVGRLIGDATTVVRKYGKTYHLHWITPIGEINMTIDHVQKKIKTLFQFDSASISVTSSVSGSVVNGTGNMIISGNGFKSLATFSKFNVTADLEAQALVLGMVSGDFSMHLTKVNGFSFKKFYMSESLNSSTENTKFASMLSYNMKNTVGFFNIDYVQLLTGVHAQSPFVDTSFFYGAEAQGVRGPTQVQRFNCTTAVKCSSSLFVYKLKTDVVVDNSQSISHVDYIAIMFENSVESGQSAMLAVGGFELIGQQSTLVYEKLVAGANVTVSTSPISLSLQETYEVVDSNGLFSSKSFRLTSRGTMNSVLSSGDFELLAGTANQNGAFTFDNAVMSLLSTINSPTTNLTLDTKFEIQGQVRFLHYKYFNHSAFMYLDMPGEVMQHSYTFQLEEGSGWFRNRAMNMTYSGEDTGLFNSSVSYQYSRGDPSDAGVHEGFQYQINIASSFLNASSSSISSTYEPTKLADDDNDFEEFEANLATPLGDFYGFGLMQTRNFEKVIHFHFVTAFGEGNVTMTVARNKFVNPFQFEDASLKVDTIFTGKFVNMSGFSLLAGKGFSGPFNFVNFTVTSKYVSSLPLETTASSDAFMYITHMNGLAFEKCHFAENYQVDSDFLNANAMHETTVNNLRGVFDFDYGLTAADFQVRSSKVDLGYGFISDISGAQGVSHFKRFRWSSSANTSLPMFTHQLSGELNISSMAGLTQAKHMTAEFVHLLETGGLSFLGNGDFELVDSTATFTFDTVNVLVNVSMKNADKAMKLTFTHVVYNSTGFLFFDEFTETSVCEITSSDSSSSYSSYLQYLQGRGLFNFGDFSTGTNALFSNSKTNWTFDMHTKIHNATNFLYFKLMDTNCSISMNIGDEDMNHMYRMIMTDSSGWSKYGQIDIVYEGENRGVFNSNASYHFHVDGMSEMWVYDEFSNTYMVEFNSELMNGSVHSNASITQSEGFLSFLEIKGQTSARTSNGLGEAEGMILLHASDVSVPLKAKDFSFHGSVSFEDFLQSGVTAKADSLSLPQNHEGLYASWSLESQMGSANFSTGIL